MNQVLDDINFDNYVVIGVSAGPDSMCLLDLLEKKTNKIIVCHINHNIRKQSIIEENYLKEYCQKHNLIFETMTIKEYKENDDDIEVISDFDNDIINVPSLSIAKKEKNIDDVISKIQKVVEEVKELGFEAKLEEYDFDGLYQFVIKVDNEN